ncbi:hypothetical protein LTS15_000883 [Exophiala xenobiotica]|nr:hypothetical protein LTS15_000883 [Exophiala xenobiotica]
MASRSSNSIGETSLHTLLLTLNPVLHEPTYIFLTIPDSQFVAPSPFPLQHIQMFFREAKSVTLIIRHDVALQNGLLPKFRDLENSEYDVQYQYPCRMITCNVHSSLEAVGFMAHLATKLAERGISVNPVSAYYHDHLFVPVKQAEEAVKILEQVRHDAGGAPADITTS